MKTKCIFLSLLFIFLTISCKEDITTTFIGQIQVSPETASIGDEISISISTSLISVSTTVDGKNIIKSIEYYIDEEMVAESNLENENWKATYKIVDLTPGFHTITAHCITTKKSYTIEEAISPVQILIE